ncbi:beta family protein [Methylibium sp. Root1272]|uniref:beta family protein n=1 Tax=Methylibium sp. Root1272 TaxID=1736441 RepID=UPI000700594C|nr:beta family protein [Methylibium sp. Root1272]KQW70042.1 hypothetical protein ASC67_06080 [Methylibium sp. Root1272]
MATEQDTIVYTPALKWKLGEQDAVKTLTAVQKAKTLPIAEVPGLPIDWKKNEYKKTWDQHIDDVVDATIKSWGKVQEIAVDQPMVDDDRLANGKTFAWRYLFDRLWIAGVEAVPVVSSYADSLEIAELRKAAKSNGRTRWMLRYVADQSADELPPIKEVAKWFDDTLAELKAEHTDVDAVLDLGHVGTWEIKPIAATVASFLDAIAALGSWRRISLLSGAFPKNLAGLSKGTHQIPRKDWSLYKAVKPLVSIPGNDLLFGDYGVSHIDAFEGDPRLLKMSANLRYAHWKEWHVFKAGSVTTYGYGQYISLCQLLTALPIFMTASFSAGDASHDDKATNPKAKPGNATIWRRDATNHHIHVVLHQLANPSGP